MRKVTHYTLIFALFFASVLVLSGCKRAGKAWDDTRTATRYMERDMNSLGGKHPKKSRQIASGDEFLGNKDEYVSLQEDDLGQKVGLYGPVPQSKERPGEPGSGIPSIEHFDEPSSPELAAIFKKIYFETDQHVIKGEEQFAVLRKIKEYMDGHPNLYIFVEGHCDERGTAAYNLALGTRRSNAIRSVLVKEGADLNKIFTISYGKERPIALEHTAEAWKQNRRAQFKVFNKQ